MDIVEERAQLALKIHFPDASLATKPRGKNAYPDFGLDDDIAVEVTRLTRHAHGISNEGRHGMCRSAIESVLKTVLLDHCGLGWSVSFVSSGHMTARELKEMIGGALADWNNQSCVKKVSYSTREFGSSRTLKLTIEPHGVLSAGEFQVGVGLDVDTSVTWPLADLPHSIQHALDRKAKIANQKINLFSRHWLVLVNAVTHSIADDDFLEILKSISLPTAFERIFVLNPVELSDFRELTEV